MNNINDLFDKGYKIMGTTSTADDAVEMLNDLKKYPSFANIQICRYKNYPGDEDAYAVLTLHEHVLWAADDIELEGYY